MPYSCDKAWILTALLLPGCFDPAPLTDEGDTDPSVSASSTAGGGPGGASADAGTHDGTDET
jgi:hypothetical protein